MNKAQLLMFGRVEIRSSPRTLVSAIADIAQKSKIEQRQKSRKDSFNQCLFMAHRVISLRCEVRSLSGHSGHGHACCWLDLGRE